MSESPLDVGLAVEEEPRARSSVSPGDMTNILETVMSKLAYIASTQASLLNTQESLASYQINMSERMSDISTHQADLSQSQQELRERMLGLERDRVDSTTPNPDLFKQGEVVNQTITGLPLNHLTSHPYNTSTSHFVPRRSDRIRERRLTQYGFEPGNVISSKDPLLAPSTSSPPSMVARRGEVSQTLLDVQAEGRMLSDKVREEYNGDEFGDYDDDDDDDEVRRLCNIRHSDKIVSFRPERMGNDEGRMPTKEQAILTSRSIGTTTETNGSGETQKVTAGSSMLGTGEGMSRNKLDRTFQTFNGTSYQQVSDAFQTENHHMQTDFINPGAERERHSKEFVSFNQFSRSCPSKDGPNPDEYEMNAVDGIDFDVNEVCVDGTRDKLGQIDRGMSVRGLKFGNSQIVHSQIVRERPRNAQHVTATVQRSSSEPGNDTRRPEFIQPPLRLPPRHHAPQENDVEQINENPFRNAPTSTAPRVQNQPSHPVNSANTTLTTSAQRPRMNVNQNAQPSRRFRELPSDDAYDYGPMPEVRTTRLSPTTHSPCAMPLKDASPP